jgi:ABC-type sugar transport system, permease component
MNKLKESSVYQIIAHIIMILLCITVVLPFIVLIMSSFTDETTAIMNGYSMFPAKFSLEAYKYIITRFDVIGRAYGITICVTLLGTAISLTITSLMAYGLSKKDLPYRNILMFIVIFTMLFNGGLIPTYYIYTQIFHIKNTYFAYIVPNLLMSAFNIILMRNYYLNSIPASLQEAARIDGCGEFRIFFTIVLPLSLPISATVGLMTCIAYWNDWANALYYMSDSKMASIQQVLRVMTSNVSFLASTSETIQSGRSTPGTTVRMAIAVIAIIPIMTAYPFFQKYFVKGITIGAVKE